MEPVITRDTDILREYLGALDARERQLSPFARLTATVKLSRLRRELEQAHVEATDEDFAALRREIDERLNRTLIRRIQSRGWGARLFIFLMLVVGQQLALGLIWLGTMLYERFAPVPRGWNPLLPHEEPGSLFAFVFLLFFMTPMLTVCVLFGGRFFRAWKSSLTATVVIFLLCATATYLVVRGKVNPVNLRPSVTRFAQERNGAQGLQNYHAWVDANWLMKDPKFQRDYESYLRGGPGRWITSRLEGKEDAAWTGSLQVMSEYLDGGRDPNGFREWLKYYLDRNKIYSAERIDQEVSAMTADDGALGLWQVEPFLKERDRRIYRAYLGSIDGSMKLWGQILLALWTLGLLAVYLAGPVRSLARKLAGGGTPIGSASQIPEGATSAPPSLDEYRFPERSEITTPAFFDTPFKLLAHVHRSFVRLAVFSCLLVFAYWAAVYASELTSGRQNAASQAAMMRGNLLFGRLADSGDDAVRATAATAKPDARYATLGWAARLESTSAEPEARVDQIERRLDDEDYESTRKFREQAAALMSQHREIDLLKGLSSQLQQTTSPLSERLAELSSRAGAVEARAGEVVGEINAAKQRSDNLEKQISAKLAEVENRAARAGEQVGKVEDQASVLATRTEALEKELDRRARQIEARTEELGERTAALREREERINRLQRVAFEAILSNLTADVDSLDRRVQSALVRLLNKGEARRDAESLEQRITRLGMQLRELKTEQADHLIEKLDALQKRVQEIASRVK